MATMLLVRHGQASWFEENYDRLSSVGEAQSRLLGELWAGRGMEVTRVFTGPRLRQVRSAELCGEAYSASGRHWPAPVVLEDFDEMRIEPVFREQMPELFERHAHLRALGDAMLAAGGDLGTVPLPRAARAPGRAGVPHRRQPGARPVRPDGGRLHLGGRDRRRRAAGPLARRRQGPGARLARAQFVGVGVPLLGGGLVLEMVELGPAPRRRGDD